MFSILVLGITKEMRSNRKSVEASKRQRELETDLAKTTSELQVTQAKLAAMEPSLARTTSDLQTTTAELQATRGKLAALEPNLLQAMLLTTSGIQRESDFSTTEIWVQSEIPLVSGRTGRPLALYGGDQIDYTIFCEGGAGRFAGFPNPRSPQGGFTLIVGRTSYLLQEHGRQMIMGPIGEALPAVLRNPDRIRGCTLKMLIESADRTREASHLEPLLRLIQDAKAALANK